MSATQTRNEPAFVQTMRLNGHDPVNDPPASGMAQRYTCSRCGRATLNNRGAIYGSAKELTCDGKPVR